MMLYNNYNSLASECCLVFGDLDILLPLTTLLTCSLIALALAGHVNFKAQKPFFYVLPWDLFSLVNIKPLQRTLQMIATTLSLLQGI